MTRVFAYLRTKSLALNSLVEKRQRIRDYCKAHGFALMQIFEDRGLKTGINRKGILRLLATLEQGDVVVVLKPDQLWEDATMHTLIAHQLREAHSEVTSIEEPSYSLYNDFSGAFPGEGIDRLLNLHEQLSTGLRLSRGRLQKAERGERSSGAAPFGYKWLNGKMVIDLESEKMVQDIFEGYLRYGSIGKLKGHLDKSGITKPNGTGFSKEVLRVILTNGFYAGYLNSDEKGTFGAHTPIITPRTFLAVESLLSANRRNMNN